MTDRMPALVVLALCALATLHRCEVSAQSDEVVAARICVSESRWSGDECRAITATLAERAALRGVTPRAMMHAYAPRATGRRPWPHHEWIASLDPDRRPRVRDAETVRVRFASLVVIAWEALRGIGERRCSGALHWSSRHCRSCRQRMQAAGLVLLPCPTLNAFWGVR